MAELSAKDIEKAKFTFSIFESDGKIDAFYLGDAFRGLGLNPTLKMITKLGGIPRRGEKQFSIEEFLPLYNDAKRDKDQGCLEDYIECLKLYDKDENGKMQFNQLNHILQAYGEKLDADELAEIMKDCCEEPDDQGLIPWLPFLQKMTHIPEPGFPMHPQQYNHDEVKEDVPSVSLSFSASKPMPEAEPDEPPPEPSAEEGETPEASFSLKLPKKS